MSLIMEVGINLPIPITKLHDMEAYVKIFGILYRSPLLLVVVSSDSIRDRQSDSRILV